MMLVGTAWPSTAQQSDGWKEERGIFTTVHNAPLILSGKSSESLLQVARKQPVLLALVFTRCTGVCSPFLAHLKEQVSGLDQDTDFRVIVVSFDPRDTATDMQAYAERLGLGASDRWIFAVTPEIDDLVESVGFSQAWDENNRQFEHDALLAGINTEGYLTRKLLGLRNRSDLKAMVRSINNEFSPSYRLPTQNRWFSCFNYNPDTGRSTPGLGLLFIALPAVVSFGLLLTIRAVQR